MKLNQISTSFWNQTLPVYHKDCNDRNLQICPQCVVVMNNNNHFCQIKITEQIYLMLFDSVTTQKQSVMKAFESIRISYERRNRNLPCDGIKIFPRNFISFWKSFAEIRSKKIFSVFANCRPFLPMNFFIILGSVELYSLRTFFLQKQGFIAMLLK